MKKVAPFVGLLGLLLTCSWIILSYERPLTEKEKYANWFAEYRENMPEASDYEGKDRYDRPDMFFEFDRMKRVNPTTGEIPEGALLKAYYEVLAMQSMEKTGNALDWYERGPSGIGGRTRAVLWDPNDATRRAFFAGGVGGALWRSNNITAGTPGWTMVSDGFSNVAITCIAADPSDPQTMYYGTGEGWFNADAQRGAGIWRSLDGGLTWSHLPSTDTNAFNLNQKIAVTDNGNVYFGTKSGLFKSTDKGNTVYKVLGLGTGMGSDWITDIEIAADGDLYVAINGFGVYHSPASLGASQGEIGSWTRQTTGFSSGYDRVELATAPSNSNYVYALVEFNQTIDRVYRTTNGGTTWTATSSEPNDDDGGIPSTDASRGQAWYDLSLGVDPNNEDVVYAGGVDLFKSTNKGDSWDQISHWYGGWGHPYVHADQHAMAFRPGSSNEIVFANDGGVQLTNNAGASYTEKNVGYNVTQFYSISVDPRAGNNTIIGGTQDNGTIMTNAAAIGIGDEISGGDGGFCEIHTTDADTMFVTSQYQSIRRSKNGGSSFNSITNSALNNGNTLFINPFEMSKTNPNTLYQASHELWRNNNASASNSWIKCTKFITGGGITAVTSAGTSNYLVYFAGAGTIYRLENANLGNWLTDPPTVDPSGNPAGYISSIAVNPSDSNHIVITYTSYGLLSHVYECRDAWKGDSATWRDINGNLPDLPVNWAIFEPNNDEGILIGTDLGVFRCGDISADEADIFWNPERTGMGLPRVDMLYVRESDKTVHAGTHGRGFFSTNSYNLAPIAAFGVEDTVVCGGLVQFVDSSYNAPVSWYWDFDDGSNSTLPSPTHVYASTGTYNVKLVVGNPHGTDSTISTMTITVVDGAVATAWPDTSVCNGELVTLHASGGVSYSWSPSFGLDDPNSPNPSLTVTTNIDYIVTVTDSNGCTATDTATVGILATPPVWAGPDKTITIIGDSVMLEPDGGISYEWSPSTGLSCTSCENPMASPDTTTTYTVVGMGANGCTRSDIVVVKVEIVSNDKPANTGSIQLFANYPNPFSDETTIRYYLPKPSSIQLSVMDLRGRRIAQLDSGNKSAGIHKLCWNRTGTNSKIGSGIYFLILESEGKKFTQKMIIKH